MGGGRDALRLRRPREEPRVLSMGVGWRLEMSWRVCGRSVVSPGSPVVTRTLPSTLPNPGDGCRAEGRRREPQLVRSLSEQMGFAAEFTSSSGQSSEGGRLGSAETDCVSESVGREETEWKQIIRCGRK